MAILRSRLGPTAALLAALLACTQAPATAQAGPGAHGGPGRVLYVTYCQSCHGPDGTGTGYAAHYLRTPPADLTRLSERYGTPLDRKRLVEYIDGRRLLTAHELREMPIWGDEFFAEVPPDTPGVENLRRRVIEVLIDYLEQLQSERQS